MCFETCKVILVHGIEARHLGGLAADEGSTGLDTALGHTAHDGGDLLGDVLTAGNVVQEEQGLCAHADDVVDAHSHGVDADGVVLVHEDGQLHLGAAAVGAGDQNGLGHTRHVEAEAAAEAAHVVHAALVLGAGNVPLHQLDRLVAGGNVYAGGGVAFGLGIRMHGSISFRLFSFYGVGLLFAVPAVGAELIGRQADGLNDTAQGLEFQGGEAELVADALAEGLAALGGGVGIFVKMLVACFAIAVPIATYFMTTWLQEFAYKAPLHLWVYVVAFIVVALLVVAGVVTSSWRVVTQNPVEVINRVQ